MSEASKQGCRVVLTGQGGDYWLHGTRAYYAEELAARRWSTLLDCLREDSIAFGPAQSLRWFLRHGAYQQVPLWIRDRVRPSSRQSREAARSEAYWLSPSMRALLRQRREEHKLPVQPTPVHPGQRRLLESLRDPLMAHVIDRFEREGARASIELRHPVLDTEIHAICAFDTGKASVPRKSNQVHPRPSDAESHVAGRPSAARQGRVLNGIPSAPETSASCPDRNDSPQTARVARGGRNG